eukprot:2503121-Rhodomonas_salina.1
MSGTDKGCYAHAMQCPAITLRRCYAMSGTDILFAAKKAAPPQKKKLALIMDEVGPPMVLRARYAMPGTEIAYVLRAMRYSGLRKSYDFRDGDSVWCSIPGTGMAYGAMRCPVDGMSGGDAVRLFMAAVRLFMGAVRLFMGAVRLFMAAVLLFMAAVLLFMAPRQLSMVAVLLLMDAILPLMAAHCCSLWLHYG